MSFVVLSWARTSCHLRSGAQQGPAQPTSTFPARAFHRPYLRAAPHGHSYDVWYVALAEELGFPLATLNEHLAKVGGPRGHLLTPGLHQVTCHTLRVDHGVWPLSPFPVPCMIPANERG